MNRRWTLVLAFCLLDMSMLARAQPAEHLRRIGWLSPIGGPRLAFVEALRQQGWVDGKNIAFEIRDVRGQREKLTAMAADLVAARVDVIVAVAPAAIQAARRSTSTIPIVMAFWGGPDLVESGVVSNYARPGGNVTGVDMRLSLLDAKRLDMLRQALPNAKRIAVLVHDEMAFEAQLPPVRDTARAAGLDLLIVNTRQFDGGYERAFEAISRSEASALLVMSSPDFSRDRKLLIDEAARWRVPAMFGDGTGEGALMTYAAPVEGLDRLAASYVDRIFRGAKAGDLPIEQPTKYQFTVNLRTAKALGITIPQSTLLRADLVID